MPKLSKMEVIYTFNGTEITCPVEAGHRMIPVKTVCSIIDVDFQKQDIWLKKDSLFGQLYKFSTATGADGKQYKMRCLSFLDLYGWLCSISDNNRKSGSVEKQYAFMLWLREQHMTFYKSVEVFAEENAYELQLLEKKTELIERMEANTNDNREIKAELKKIAQSLQDVREKRFTGQTALPFPSDN